MGPCEVGADTQTVRGGEGVYNSGARGITVFVGWLSPLFKPMKMEPIRSSETSAIKIQTHGELPKREHITVFNS